MGNLLTQIFTNDGGIFLCKALEILVHLYCEEQRVIAVYSCW